MAQLLCLRKSRRSREKLAGPTRCVGNTFARHPQDFRESRYIRICSTHRRHVPSFRRSTLLERGPQMDFQCSRSMGRDHAAFRRVCKFIFAYSRRHSGWSFGALILRWAPKKSPYGNWPLLAMAFGALGTYALVHVENRFLPAYMVLFWMSLLLGVELPSSTARDKLVYYLL